MGDFLSRAYFNNTVLDYLIAAAIIVAGISIIRLFKKTLLNRIKSWTNHTHTHFDDFVIDSIGRFGIPALYFGIVYLGLSSLTLTPRGENILRIAVTFVVTYLFIRLISSIIFVLLKSYVRRQERGEEKIKQLGGLMLIINAVIWIIGLIFLFDNMGYDVTAVVTGLGIGGIAIALAAQNILGDLFNYFVIFFDRPFEVGDFVVIDEKSGTVDYIGIKTTRIKALSGEQLVFSNSDLTSSRIHNYKRMQQRRIVFKFGVVYQVSPEQLQQIPGIVKSIIETQQEVIFDRAHFTAYGESSLDFEVVYIILNSDYTKYMDVQQAINLAMFKQFKDAGVKFAYPTRTLFMVNQNGQPAQPQQPVISPAG